MHRHTTTVARPPTGPLGPVGEHLAVAHLRDDGLEVVTTNWAVRSGLVRGELDVVAFDETAGAVVVVEVKARRSMAHGGPLVAVTPTKQRRIRALASAWLQAEAVRSRRVRFDVVGVLLRDGEAVLDHVPGAF